MSSDHLVTGCIIVSLAGTVMMATAQRPMVAAAGLALVVAPLLIMLAYVYGGT